MVRVRIVKLLAGTGPRGQLRKVLVVTVKKETKTTKNQQETDSRALGTITSNNSGKRIIEILGTVKVNDIYNI